MSTNGRVEDARAEVARMETYVVLIKEQLAP